MRIDPLSNLAMTCAVLLATPLAFTTAVIADDISHAKALSGAFRSASKKVLPAVVTITVYGQPSVGNDQGAENKQIAPFRQFSPQPEGRNPAQGNNMDRATELGSGVVFAENGWILTNHHVVADARRLVVENSLRQTFDVLETHSDPESDLAIVRVDAHPPLPVAELGASATLEIGDWVLAIGSPFQLQASVSAGIISAVGRRLPRVPRALLLQTDAAINPGNSGGPLINLDGQVVGINTAIATRGGGYEGIGFAVPAEQVAWIAKELRTHGKVRRASLGVQVSAPDPKAGFAPGATGAMVVTVVGESAAAKAGLKPLDLIVAVAGQEINQPGDLRQAIERLPTDSQHPMTLIRDGKEISVEIQPRPLD